MIAPGLPSTGVLAGAALQGSGGASRPVASRVVLCGEMTDIAHLNYTFDLSNEHVREEPDGSLVVSGWASNFDVDRVGDTVTRKALERALTGYMRNPVLLYNHQYSQPAGVVTKALVNDRGLWIEAKLPRPEGGLPRHYFDLVKRGVMRALSIGGVWKRDALRRLVEIDLREISVAAVGVNSGTLLSAQAGKAFGDEPDDGLAALSAAGDALDRLALRAEVAALRERIHG